MDIDLPPPPPPPAPLREAPHVDGKILTLAWAPKPVGLQVRRGKTGAWEKNSGENGSNMVVMAGAVLQHATGGADYGLPAEGQPEMRGGPSGILPGHYCSYARFGFASEAVAR